MKVYRGDRTIDGVVVTVDGRPLDPRLDLGEFSSEGFEWSYEGAAPAQLALAILADFLGDGTLALGRHEAFMRAVVANFNNEWEMTEADVAEAVANIFGEQAGGPPAGGGGLTGTAA